MTRPDQISKKAIDIPNNIGYNISKRASNRYQPINDIALYTQTDTSS